MPELPEVETIVRRLRPGLVGRTVTAVHMGWPQHSPTPDELKSLLPGRKVAGLGRRAKYVVLDLEPSDRTLLIHLGMSGRLSIAPPDAEPGVHAHTVFVLDNGHRLRFSDARKFGRVYLVADREAVLGELGPEPLSAWFTVDWLVTHLARRRRVIKPLIMEQRFISGLGNIYADEALHRAGVDPRRRANGLAPSEAGALHRSIREVLTEALEYGGTTFDWVYPDGRMQARLRVYGRGGDSCMTCGTAIERVMLQQRSTHFCPTCQR